MDEETGDADPGEVNEVGHEDPKLDWVALEEVDLEWCPHQPHHHQGQHHVSVIVPESVQDPMPYGAAFHQPR